jgi:organic radical activating enzyme
LIYLSEYFLSLQGEGAFSGHRSLFLRFGGCNLECSGFGVPYKIGDEQRYSCDSFYSVDRYFQKEWKKVERPETILEIVSRYDVYDVVITGGEPLLYWKNPIFQTILKELHKSKRVTIETNGTIEIGHFSNTVFAISPKLSNSKEKFQKRFNFKALQSLQNRNSFFKFVLDKKSLQNGLGEEVLEYQKLFPETPIYCMPLGENRQKLEENSEAVANFSIQNGFIFSDRIQVRIWDKKRGI